MSLTSRALVLVRSSRLGRLVSARRRAARVQRLVGRALSRVVARWPSLFGAIRTAMATQQRQIIDVDHFATAKAPPPPEPDTQVPVDELLEELAQAPDWQSRKHAAQTLATAEEDERVTDALVAALRDPSAEVAIAVLTSLSARPSKTVTDILCDVIANRDGYFASVTRAQAISALAASHGDDASTVRALSDAVFDVDAEVSLSAIEALSAKPTDAATAPLLSVLRDRSGFFLPIVRLAAARGLSQGDAISDALRSELLDGEGDAAIRDALVAPSSLN